MVNRSTWASGQRVRALELDRVLRREHDERARELVRVDVDGDAALLHALEQTGLRLGRRAVDLVDEHDVGEDRARPELEAVLAPVEDVHADDVGGQEVRGALHARELEIERPGERAGERRLAHAREVLDEDVPLGEERDDEVGDDLPAHLDARLDVPGDPPAELDSRIDLLSGDPRLLRLRALHSTLHSYAGVPAALSRRTSARTARATSDLAARGTCCSPSAVMTVTSLSAASNPMPA